MGENSSLGEKQQGRVLVSLALGGSPGEHPFHLENGDNPIKHTGLLSWGPNKSMLWNVTWCCNSLAVQWLRLCFPVQGVRVRSLVGELRSHMLWGCGQYFFNIKTKKNVSCCHQITKFQGPAWPDVFCYRDSAVTAMPPPTPKLAQFSTPMSAVWHLDPECIGTGHKLFLPESHTLCVCLSLSLAWLFATPQTMALQAPLSMGIPSKNTGLGSCSLLQGIFPTQGLNLGLPALQADSLPAEPPEKPSLYHYLLYMLVSLLLYFTCLTPKVLWIFSFWFK